MKFLKIVLFLILGFNVNAQIELFQLQWATDSSYVIGALPSGEPIWVHVDSLGIADSIYFSGGRVYLRDGSGSALIPVPSVTGTISGHQIGVFNSGTGDPTTPIRETVTTFSGIASGVRTYTSEDGTMYYLDAESTNELQELNLLDSTDRVFTLEITNGNIVKWKDQVGSGVTQYLNPYVVTGDTTGFYLTVAQDTVLFVATADTTAGTVDIVTGTSPIIITGDATHTPNVTIQNATTSQSGALTSTDWNTFNAKVGGSGTSTRVAFWSGTSTLSSNANLYWDNTNSRLGIGTASPSKQLTTTQDISANSNDIGLGGGNQPNNARFGNAALNNNTTGVGNLAIGAYALLNNTTGYYNIALGNQAMFYNVSGHTNTAIGQNTLLYNTGSKNTGIGTEALYSLTSGVENTAISALALRSNVTGNSNIAIGFGAGYYETGSNKLYIEPTTSSTPLIGGDFVTDRVGINTAIGSISRTLHVGGEVRITDLTTDTPTGLVGHDADGDIGSVALSGLSMVSGTLTNSFNGDITAVTVTAPLTGGGTSGSISVGLDTTSATGVATQYDLTQVVGSSKVIDILGSDFTTSATTLQTTDLAYTFPSTGTYEVKLYGQYTSSNTANGILCAYVESGGLTASFVTGSHYVYDRSTSASGSTVAIRGVSALGHVIATASVANASSPLTIMSEILVTVSATGTLTFNFASESGSYSATLVAGSSLIVEKLD